MFRRYALTLVARSRLKPCSRVFDSCCLPHTLPKSSSSPSILPIFASARMQYASSSRGRRSPPRKAAADDDDEDEDDDDIEFEDVEDNSGYEFDYETWNLLHQGKKDDEKSRKWPLPMYKAREMVDYHMIKNRIDGLKVITDPKLEYELRKQLHEGLVEFYRKTQAAFDEIDAAQEKKEVESGEEEKILQVTEGETKSNDSEEQKSSVEVASSQVDLKDGEAESSQQLDARKDGDINTEENGAQSLDLMSSSATVSDAGDEVSAEESSVEPTDLSEMTSAVDDILKDVHTVPELTTIGSGKDVMEAKSEGTVDNDEVNVFNYDNWVAYREQEMAKRYAEEEQKKHATLRWKIQLVLGPGDVWHPANRKASVSVYVRELGLSKFAKQRLLALVGKRYKSPKDELTIVSERYQHRYENQKDVLRTLLDLIEEAKKADQLVNDARIGYLKAQNKESKAAGICVA